MTDHRLRRSPLSTDSSKVLVVADDSGECGDGCGEIRQDLGPDRHHRVVGCQRRTRRSRGRSASGEAERLGVLDRPVVTGLTGLAASSLVWHTPVPALRTL